MIMIVLLSMIAITFFVFLTGYSLRNLEQVYNLENSVIGNYAAEGGIERNIVEYFSQEPNVTINESDLSICTSVSDFGEAIIDFFNCPAGEKIGTLDLKATRYRKSITGYLDRYDLTELWLTDDELETEMDLEHLKKLRIEWNTYRKKEEDAGLEVILVRWIKGKPKFTQTARKYFEAKPGIQLQEIGEFIPVDDSVGVTLADQINAENFEYILFLKSNDKPTHYRITGLDSSGNEIQLPSSKLTVLSKAIMEDKRDPSKTIVRSYQVEKEIYTDGDSNFDYSRHRIK